MTTTAVSSTAPQIQAPPPMQPPVMPKAPMRPTFNRRMTSVRNYLLLGFLTVFGLVGGIALALNIDVVVPAIERLFNTQFLAKEVYYISELPSDLQWRDVGVIAAVSFALTLLATLYPSWRASRVNPAEALRYE